MVKKAFTLIELIFIIVLVGIMSSVAVSAFREDKLALATYQVLEHIRYTQHLAITDHKFDPKDEYYQNIQNDSIASAVGKYFASRWQIRFYNTTSGSVYYYIFSDRDRRTDADTTNHIEAARDPFEKQYFIMYDTSGSGTSENGRRNPNVLISDKYEIKSLAASASCQPKLAGNPTKAYISFDEKGRPYTDIDYSDAASAYDSLLLSDCVITLTHQDGRSSEITIYPETGYAEITKLE